MESQRVVVVVEEEEAARAALRWAVRNFIRSGDSITLLYVCPFTRSKKKQRNLRLKGFQLALSFKDMCNGIAEAKVEILVTEGDPRVSVASTVSKIRATTLFVGLHDRSFLYKTPDPNFGMRSLDCRVLAIKQHHSMRSGFINMEFSQIEPTSLHIPEPKIPFPIFTLSMIWRRSKRRK
ncbi:uncharacterized protein [Typha latifolia]|uniref:uncharacterized protein n=1 Tax=Typha latifolia TaxID=4733 RepID=UPI003C2F7B59